MIAFLLNRFCSRLAVYLGNYVILFLFSPSGPFHLALWEDRLVIFLTHSGGKLLCQTHFRHSTGSVLPLWLFLITFSLCHSLALSSQSLCVSLLRWHAHVLLRGDWQQQMISMMHHSSNCSWHTHSLSRSHKWGTPTMRKIFFPSIFSEWFANSARRLKWTSVHKVHCAHTDACTHVAVNVNGDAQCGYKHVAFPTYFLWRFGMIAYGPDVW